MDTIDELVARSKDCKEVRRFHQFHRSHPEILDILVEEIRLRFNRGFAAFSYHRLWEYVRWKLEMERGPDDLLMMDDRCASLYACAIAILHPEFDGLAEFNKDKAYRILRTQVEVTARASAAELWVPGQWYSFADWMAARATVLARSRFSDQSVEQDSPLFSMSTA
jgi:hypothetical protein